MVYDILIRQVRDIIRQSIIHSDIEYAVEPARSGFGDISSNVAFLLSKRLHQSPADVARIIADGCIIPPDSLIDTIRAHPSGYVNAYARWDKLAYMILESSIREGYGSIKTGQSCIIEHTSVNPNKALHIGHARNIIVGDVVSRILRKAGHKVTILNYVDDLGLQVADIVLGFRHFKYDIEPPKGIKFDAYCGDTIYVDTNAQYDKHPELYKMRSDILYNIEQGDTDDARMAKEITRRVLAAQLSTCWKLGASYDILNFESHIVQSGLWSQIFDKLKKMKIATYESEGENAGCWVIRDKVLVRSNGTATYMAKDIPYAAWKMGIIKNPFRYVRYEGQPGNTPLYQTIIHDDGIEMPLKADMVITVIDSRQSNLQEMISNILYEMGGKNYIHLRYEAVTLSEKTAKDMGISTDGKTQMSGRRGIYVSVDSVYDTLYRKAYSETSKRNPDMGTDALHLTSHVLSVATLRYEMIRQDLGRPITFDMDKSTRLDGDTAPYILYAYARACRVLEKVWDFGHADTSCIYGDKELHLLRLLGMYPIIIRDAASNLSPKVVARYCHDLAVAFNAFYESCTIIGSGAHQGGRLYMTRAFGAVMHDALHMLGIDAPHRM
ncbi:MAG: arginine--tRNA ligase [Cenarchaeum sp. SB0661_bin_35]|nr:arginine--tRNA ligase [Cenarchaeum sp. SB0667_bin_13]MYC80049.1 arginine--tRNA ligase [Cenarchaeum sp. SB0661_bin_35]MYI51483.1 arginine--tRNA ligase [Cenarchaeum sp. SB0673_bin_9]